VGCSYLLPWPQPIFLPLLKTYGWISPAQFIETRYKSALLSKLYAFLIVVITIPYVAIQARSGGRLILYPIITGLLFFMTIGAGVFGSVLVAGLSPSERDQVLIKATAKLGGLCLLEFYLLEGLRLCFLRWTVSFFR